MSSSQGEMPRPVVSGAGALRWGESTNNNTSSGNASCVTTTVSVFRQSVDNCSGECSNKTAVVASLPSLFSGMEVTRTQCRRRAAAERTGTSHTSRAESLVSGTLHSEVVSTEVKTVESVFTGAVGNQTFSYESEQGVEERGEFNARFQEVDETPVRRSPLATQEDARAAVLMGNVKEAVSTPSVNSAVEMSAPQHNVKPSNVMFPERGTLSFMKSAFGFISGQGEKHENSGEVADYDAKNDVGGSDDAPIIPPLCALYGSKILSGNCSEKTQHAEEAAAALVLPLQHEFKGNLTTESMNDGRCDYVAINSCCFPTRGEGNYVSTVDDREDRLNNQVRAVGTLEPYNTSNILGEGVEMDQQQVTHPRNISGSVKNRKPWEERWDRRRQEVREAERNVLKAVETIAIKLGEVHASIEERRKIVRAASEVEKRIEQCIIEEAFDGAEALNAELTHLFHRVAELDDETLNSFLPSLTKYGTHLQSEVIAFAELLRQHHQDVLDSGDTAELEIQTFITESTQRLNSLLKDIASQMERSIGKQQIAQQKMNEICERKDGIMKTIREQNYGTLEIQQQLGSEVAEIDEEMEELEAKLAELRRLRAIKMEKMKEMEQRVRCSLDERRMLESELDKLITRAEKNLFAANEEVEKLRVELESYESGRAAFEVKKELILEEWECETSTAGGCDLRRVSLETQTLTSVREYTSSLTTLLRLRSDGICFLGDVAPSIDPSSPESQDCLLSVTHNLRKKLSDLEMENEMNDKLVKLLDVKLVEMRSSLAVLGAMKQTAIQARQFREAQAKSDEIRELSDAIKREEETRTNIQKRLQTIGDLREELQKRLCDENSQCEVKVREYLFNYKSCIDKTEEAGAALVDALHNSIGKESMLGSVDLVEATQQLVDVLREELEGASMASSLNPVDQQSSEAVKYE
ncbi:hypothetical protein, conserved [Trypanosoma brucei brucei TREU927]|uniref:Uncharacterized protein n=1 Tax=Trypanosoma brucei brucei (strain 927/4 GUTat10.1) TaxID=185431 RepID=Q57ZU7_TRYB2|nr:hypothetical protein, conserved [Trypanosoma brucei brucei TREU927]AAX79377.1 hypothetical protein, conserved [Trypanosoma brucei]AAZ11384.1 hypothetical protein, conserved [Trypanosoma brucei brucei TREU927]